MPRHIKSVLRSLTDQGRAQFDAWIVETRAGQKDPFLAPPTDLLTCRFSRDVKSDSGSTIALAQQVFASRWHFASHVVEAMREAGMTTAEILTRINEPGLLEWLLLFYRSTFFLMQGQRRLGENCRYVVGMLPESGRSMLHRHLCWGPLHIYAKYAEHHPAAARAWLAGPANESPHLFNQILSRRSVDGVFSIDAIVPLVFELYGVHGANGPALDLKPDQSSGSVEHLIRVLNQVAYDLVSMNTAEIVAILPDEFRKSGPVARAKNRELEAA